ncbi:hypothetical protein OROHE_008080 [Orobanche hederae]
MMLTSMLFNRCVGGGVAVAGFAAVVWWGLSKLLGVSNEKIMKAPGKDYYIPRKDFEHNPADWFQLRYSINGGKYQELCFGQIGRMLRQRGKSLCDYDSMPYPKSSYFVAPYNLLISEEQNYDTVSIAHEHAKEVRATFLWRSLSAAIKSLGEIVLNVVSSITTATLLPEGRRCIRDLVFL